LAGAVLSPEPHPAPFAKTYGLTPDLVAREQALAEPAVHLERLAAQVARQWTQE
jgi:hypothetical protein